MRETTGKRKKKKTGFLPETDVTFDVQTAGLKRDPDVKADQSGSVVCTWLGFSCLRKPAAKHGGGTAAVVGTLKNESGAQLIEKQT